MGEKYFELPNPPDHLRQKCHQIIGALGIEPRILAPHPSGLATGVLPLWGHLSKKTFYGGVKLSKTQLGGASTHLIRKTFLGTLAQTLASMQSNHKSLKPRSTILSLPPYFHSRDNEL